MIASSVALIDARKSSAKLQITAPHFDSPPTRFVLDTTVRRSYAPSDSV